MKKTNLFVAALLGSAITLSSCSSEENVVSEDSNLTEMGVNVGISGNVDSRAGITEKDFTNGETLGLYIYRNDMTVAGDAVQYNFADMVGVANPTVNVPYQIQTDNKTWKAVPQPIILSNVKGNVYAYYPYVPGNSANDGRSIPTIVSADQQDGQSDGVKDEDNQIDYMWSTPLAGVWNMKPKVNLTMNHALAKVSFRFKHAAKELKYPGDGVISQIMLNSVYIGEAALNITNGTFDYAKTTKTGNITLKAIQQGDKGSLIEEGTLNPIPVNLIPSLLVYPHTLAGATVTVTIDDLPYTVSVPATMPEFVAGKHYTMLFTVKGTELVVNDVNITQWINEEAKEGDISNPDGQDQDPSGEPVED